MKIPQIVIPNKMGIVLYHPSSATSGLCQSTVTPGTAASSGITVSQKSEQLCRLLVQRYRVNLLDHAVNQHKGIRVVAKEITPLDPEKSDVNFFRLGMAALNGDSKLVTALLREGTSVTRADYDRRLVCASSTMFVLWRCRGRD